MNRMMFLSIVLAVVVVVTGVVVLVSRLIYRHETHPTLKLPVGVPHRTERFGFSDTYTISGVIHLPLDDIHEPFHAWYSRGYRMSRIDYYYGECMCRVVHIPTACVCATLQNRCVSYRRPPYFIILFQLQNCNMQMLHN